MLIVNCQHVNPRIHFDGIFSSCPSAIQQINHYPLDMHYEPKPFEFLSSSSSNDDDDRKNNDDDNDHNNNDNKTSVLS